MRRATPILSDAEAEAYAAPYPDVSYKAGVRAFPDLVPATPDAPGAEIGRRARDWWANDWSGESFMAVGAQDPVIGFRAMEELRASIRRCPPPMIVEEAGHFVQEWGEPVAVAALRAFEGQRASRPNSIGRLQDASKSAPAATLHRSLFAP